MSKSILFFILISSYSLIAGDGPKGNPFKPDNLEFFRNVTSRATVLPSNSQNIFPSNYDLMPQPRMFYSQRAAGSMFDRLPSAGSISMGLTVIGCIFNIVQEATESWRARTPVAQLSDNQPLPNDQANNGIEKEEQEALDAVNSLSIEQIKMLAESEEREGNDSHYFRDRYAAMLKLQK